MPDVLGSYELLFHIASGGMAEVYAARKIGEAGFERLVAVKRMLPDLAENDEFMTMFLDEGRMAGHITSPHVVATTDLGRSQDGSPYIVMDLVLGSTLAELGRAARRRGAPVPLPVVIELIAQAAQGLHDAHDATTPAGDPLHLVHRDVTPQNILCGIDGRARITDFGVARAMLRYTRTTTGQLKGKFGYFSPEQARGEAVDRRSDVFALGVVAWEAVTGRRLFRGDNPLESLHKLVSSEPIPSVVVFRTDVPEGVAEVIQCALERDPEHRSPSALALAIELRAAAAATIGIANPEEIGRYVLDCGGGRLAELQEKLRLASTPEGRAQLLGYHAGQKDAEATGTSRDAHPAGVREEESTRLARTPTDQSRRLSTEDAIEALRPGRRRARLGIRLGIGLAGLTAGAAWFWLPWERSWGDAHEHTVESEAADGSGVSAPPPELPTSPAPALAGEAPSPSMKESSSEGSATDRESEAEEVDDGTSNPFVRRGSGSTRRRRTARLRRQGSVARRERPPASGAQPTPVSPDAQSDQAGAEGESVREKEPTPDHPEPEAEGETAAAGPGATEEEKRAAPSSPQDSRRRGGTGLAGVDDFDEFVGR